MRRKRDDLTPRQRDVVVLLRAGLNCRAIAHRLGIAPATVRKHIDAAADKVPGPHPPIRRLLLHADQLEGST